jgi:ligand-binding sensor domain-containing protein
MNFQNINSQQNTHQMMKLASIFSILFVSMFSMAIISAEDKGVVNVKSKPRAQVAAIESSLTMGDEVNSKDLTPQSDESLDEYEITKQSGTGSFISNYINAWKLSKAGSVFQITL